MYLIEIYWRHIDIRLYQLKVRMEALYVDTVDLDIILYSEVVETP